MLKNNILNSDFESPLNINTVLKLEFDGINGGNNNLPKDEIHPSRTFSVSGLPMIGSHNPFTTNGSTYDKSIHGGSCLLKRDGYSHSNNSLQYYTYDDPSDCFNFGIGDFTFEFWIKQPVDSGSPLVVMETDTFSVVMRQNKYEMFGLASTKSIIFNKWTHVAFCRNASILKCYIDGEIDAVMNYPNDIPNISAFVIGTSIPSFAFNGYIGGIRAIKGTALYTSNFSVPTSKFTNVPGTSFLVNFDNADIYDSTSKNNILPLGEARLSTTRKRTGTSSIFLNGTTDYLICNINNQDLNKLTINPSDAYTIETWVYLESFNSSSSIIISNGHIVGSVGPLWEMTISPQGNVTLLPTIGGWNPLTTTSSIQFNQWTHIAGCMDSLGNCYIFINGVLSTNSIVRDRTDMYRENSIITIGRYPSGTGYFHGYIDSLTITKGICKYTENFIPE